MASQVSRLSPPLLPLTALPEAFLLSLLGASKGEEADEDDIGDMGGVLDSSGGVQVTTLELAIIAICGLMVREEAEEGGKRLTLAEIYING